VGRIDVSKLPKYVQDVIEMREATDQTFYRFVDEDYSEWFFDLLNQRRNPEKEHSVIISCVGGQGNGKSLSAISIACYLDPTMNVNRVFFGYNDLVYNRAQLQENCAVIVDEQSQTYGLDAHRVMTILSNLKEQLRKKSIHFIFCAPVLYPESQTSMFIIETMFIDEEEQECFCALKTREGLTLGHVRIPHPLKRIDDQGGLASKGFIDAYQVKKDEHLEKVLNRKDMDVFEERAGNVVKHPLFKKAEKIYVRRYGYMPQSALIALINKIYPEFGAGVVAGEIAGRVRLNKEVAGEWELAGAGRKRVKP
jgi:hypothetical protein